MKQSYLANDPSLDNGLQKDLQKLQEKPYETLAKQCHAEYELAWQHQKPEKDEALRRLRLFNNQKRDKEAVGDTTMFSVFQTLFASLYIDTLQSKWQAREEGDEGVAENLNALSRYDATEMDKAQTDYEWIWDTLFFSRGLIDFSEYIRDPEKNIFIPIPYVLDPTTQLRDPRAKSVNGNKLHRGAARFFGGEVRMTKQEMKDHPDFLATMDVNNIKFGSSVKSLIEEARAARDAASNFQYDKNSKEQKTLGENGEYDILAWNTHWRVDGTVKKVKVWLANNHKEVVGFKVIDRESWQVIDRPLYPTSHQWRGTSIPDLTEDKQRARAVAQNLGIKFMKSDLYPSYIYDSNKIKNKNDLNFNFNKFIPADVAEGRSVLDAMAPLRRSAPNMQLLSFIYESLDISAQKATATADVQQGIQSQKDRPLGETNALLGQGQQRYSLSAKIFGWSERVYWLEWYNCYKEYFDKDIDEKVIRLEGPFGSKWRSLTADQIVTDKLDPDVEIVSLAVFRTEQLQAIQSGTAYISMALQDPLVNRRYAMKELGRLYGWEKDKLERLFPLTVDERIAEAENQDLNNNKPVQVNVADDHNVHLEIHSNAAATPATYAHIQTHIKALSIKKTNPGAFPPDQAQLAQQGQPQTGQPTNAQPPIQQALSLSAPAQSTGATL